VTYGASLDQCAWIKKMVPRTKGAEYPTMGRYQTGNEHNPVDPFGRAELAIAGDGAAQLRSTSRFGRRAWQFEVAPEALTLLSAALRRARFPEKSLAEVVGDTR